MPKHMAKMCLQATFSTTVDVIGQQQASSFFLFAMWEEKTKEINEKLNEILHI